MQRQTAVKPMRAPGLNITCPRGTAKCEIVSGIPSFFSHVSIFVANAAADEAVVTPMRNVGSSFLTSIPKPTLYLTESTAMKTRLSTGQRTKVIARALNIPTISDPKSDPIRENREKNTNTGIRELMASMRRLTTSFICSMMARVADTLSPRTNRANPTAAPRKII